MENQTLINDLLEKVLKLPLDEQMMISEIIQKRIIDAKSKEMAKSVKESKEEYNVGPKVKAIKQLKRIEINPAILTGKPIIRGTRISVELIMKLVAQRWTDEQILQEYPVLKKEDIQEALHYAEMLVQNEEVYLMPSK
jgi:uncharacterized protein (DUF433 family)